jgi:hypothetical protein
METGALGLWGEAGTRGSLHPDPWLTAVDVVATAGSAAVSATSKRDLLQSRANSLMTCFAGWAIVNLVTRIADLAATISRLRG